MRMVIATKLIVQLTASLLDDIPMKLLQYNCRVQIMRCRNMRESLPPISQASGVDSMRKEYIQYELAITILIHSTSQKVLHK